MNTNSNIECNPACATGSASVRKAACLVIAWVVAGFGCGGQTAREDSGGAVAGGAGASSGVVPCSDSPGAAEILQVETGFDVTVARKGDGTLWEWGKLTFLWGSYAEWDLGSLPTQVKELGTNALAVGAGISHICAVRVDGSLWCWGINEGGEIGDGTTNPAQSPIEIGALGTNVTAIAAGGGLWGSYSGVGAVMRTCALKAGGALWCWSSGSPMQIVTLDKGVTAVSTSAERTCAVKTDGSLWCWAPGQQEPMPVSGLQEGVAAVSVGNETICALKFDGSLWCWGGWTNTPMPVEIAALGKPVAAVSVGGYHICAIELDGSLWCWGSNSHGQLGDGTEPSSSSSVVPARVTKLGSCVSSVSAGSHHTCASRTDGTLWCWGDNWAGQLGVGTSKSSAVPLQVAGFGPDKS